MRRLLLLLRFVFVLGIGAAASCAATHGRSSLPIRPMESKEALTAQNAIGISADDIETFWAHII